MKKTLALVFVPLLAVLVLGTINVTRKINWRDATDGVTWRRPAKASGPSSSTPRARPFCGPASARGTSSPPSTRSRSDEDRRPQEPLAGRGDRPERQLRDQQRGHADLPVLLSPAEGGQPHLLLPRPRRPDDAGHRAGRLFQLAGADVPPLHLLLSPGLDLRRVHDLFADRGDDGPRYGLLCARQDRLPGLPAPPAPLLHDLPAAQPVPQGPSQPPPGSLCAGRAPASWPVSGCICRSPARSPRRPSSEPRTPSSASSSSISRRSPSSRWPSWRRARGGPPTSCSRSSSASSSAGWPSASFRPRSSTSSRSSPADGRPRAPS